MEDLELAANGDADAIDRLRMSMSQDIMAKIILDNSDFIENTDAVKIAYNNLMAELPDITVGTYLDSGSFIDGLNELISSTGMTVDQVNALVDSMGFEATYATEQEPTVVKIPKYKTYHQKTDEKINPDGSTSWEETTWTVPDG